MDREETTDTVSHDSETGAIGFRIGDGVYCAVSQMTGLKGTIFATRARGRVLIQIGGGTYVELPRICLRKDKRGYVVNAPAAESGSAFRRYDQCRFAILLNLPPGYQLFKGTAHHQRDYFLGRILCIPLAMHAAGNPEVIIAEKDWNGLIVSGEPYHCDYALTVQAHPDSSGSQGAPCRKHPRKRWWA